MRDVWNMVAYAWRIEKCKIFLFLLKTSNDLHEKFILQNLKHYGFITGRYYE